MKASDLFIKSLENEGVEYIFGVPGEENLDLLESIRTSSIKLILTRHEQSAGFMAATYGRLTGKVGVCLSTLGPGATNLVTAAAYAQLGAMPMMMITGQKPIKRSKQGQFQIIDIVAMMQPITKYTKQIVNANNIPSKIREAFRLALEERPGAVHIELPEDIASESCESQPFTVEKAIRPSADEEVINDAIKLITQAKKPLLLIGAAANRKRTSLALTEFIEKTGMPFFNTQMGKGVVDERHPLFMGTAALSEGDFLHCAINRSDLIINVGHDVIEKPPFFMQRDGTKVIHINFFAANIDDVYFPSLDVVGDIANTVCRLKDGINKQSDWDFSYFERVKQELEEHLKENSEDDHFPLFPQRVINDVRQALPDDGILALDNGMYKIWFARNYKAYAANTLLLDNALASMGAGLPSAMAASLVCPERKVVAICGDGGFMMNSQELETAVRLNLNLTVIILVDNAYGMIKWKQTTMGLPDFGLDYNNPDFVKYAMSYGAHGHRVKKAKHLKKILDKTLKSTGVHIIECPIDYSENARVLDQALKQKTCVL